MKSPFLSIFQGTLQKSESADLTKIPFIVGTWDKEMRLSDDLDRLVTRSGIKIKWARCTYIATVLYAVLVMIASLARADSLNVTICALALYLLTDTSQMKRRHFRFLIIAILLSLIYDIIYMLMHESNKSGELEGAPNSLVEIAQWT